MLAQNVAIARPDLVRAMVLAGCPGAIPATLREAILRRGTDAEAGGMSSVVDGTLQRWFSEAFMSTEGVHPVRHRLLQNAPSNYAATWEAVAEHDALPHLGAIALPTLVVAGARDQATSLDAKKALAAAIPGSRLQIFTEAPHMMQIENETEFTSAVTEFLDSIGERHG